MTTQITANGSQSVTTKVLNPDGTVAGTSTETAQRQRAVEERSLDINNDGTIDHRQRDVTVFNADGSRTQTKSELSRDGVKLLSQTIATVSGNQLSKTLQTDYNGDGVYDEKVSELSVINANGSVTTTASVVMGANTLASRSVSTKSANGLSTSVDIDRDGDGTVDLRTAKTSTIYATGATGESSRVTAGNGALISSQSTFVTADKLAATTTVDLDGDGRADESEDGDPQRRRFDQHVALDLCGDRSIQLLVICHHKRRRPFHGDRHRSRRQWHNRLVKDGRYRTQWRRQCHHDNPQLFCRGVVLNQDIATTSADGLIKNTLWDATGDGAIDRSSYEVNVLNADGSTTKTVTLYKAASALESRTITTTSADQLTRVVTEDVDGDGIIDYRSESVTAANGIKTTANTNLGANGIEVTGKSVVSTYLDIWTITSRYGANGVLTGSSTTSKWIDTYGNVVQAFEEFTGAVLKQKALVTTSGDGLSKTTQWDLTGAGTYGRSRPRSR